MVTIVRLVSTQLPFLEEWNFQKNMEFPFLIQGSEKWDIRLLSRSGYACDPVPILCMRFSK